MVRAHIPPEVKLSEFSKRRLTQESARQAGKNWTDRDSEDQKCLSCIVVRCGDAECAKQDMVSLSTIQFESYMELWRCAHNSHKDRIEQGMTKMRMMIVGGLGWRTVTGFGRWIDHWRGLI